MNRCGLLPLVLLPVLVTPACSIRKYAINQLGNSLAAAGTTYASDEDPELVGEALPFSLKLIESLLAESPRHRGLLQAASSGFTQYSYVYVQLRADEAEDRDLTQATALRLRARKLYLRARDYGLRGLETRLRDFGRSLRTDPKAAVRVCRRDDVPLLYWTAAAWGSAISLGKDEPDLIADQLLVEALIDRALELEEDWDHGAIHSFLISYESSRQAAPGDPADRARRHFRRATELAGGRQAGPLVSFAENVVVPKQNKQEFRSLLEQALQIDANAKPEWRLANLVMQRRARWLLSRTDRLFLE